MTKEKNYYIDDSLLVKIINNEDVNVKVDYITGEYGHDGQKISDVLDISITEDDKFSQISENIKTFVRTIYFQSIINKLINSNQIPDINFETSEIKDKPGTFLDFTKPDALDEQLAEFYGLTVEEQELMKSSIKPWKNKLLLTADGLY